MVRGDYKREFADFMLNHGALIFGDFTTKSGRKTPYFVNTGKYNSGDKAYMIGQFYATCILQHFEEEALEDMVLFGPAYKGIPLVVSTAMALTDNELDVKFCFNRKEAKDHGEGGTLIGHQLSKGDKVLIIEDVITAGTAVREVLPIIENTGATVEGLVISVDRMERGKGERTAIQEVWDEFRIPTYAILNIKEILAILPTLRDSAVTSYKFDKDLTTRIEAYMKEYCVL